jgi:putative ABC transport system substrate-binding protein
MRRREFITLLGAAAAWPVAVRAQQPGRTYRLGFFLPVARDAPAMIAFFDELRIHGFVEGQNVAVVPGGFQVGNEQIDELVPALVKAAPDAIIAGGDVIPRALQSATRTIPIVVITRRRLIRPTFWWRCARDCSKLATPRVKTLRSSIAGRTATMTVCRRWRRTS